MGRERERRKKEERGRVGLKGRRKGWEIGWFFVVFFFMKSREITQSIIEIHEGGCIWASRADIYSYTHSQTQKARKEKREREREREKDTERKRKGGC